MKILLLQHYSNRIYFSILIFLFFHTATLYRTNLPDNYSTCDSKECLAAAESLKSTMNFSVKPCDNFYHYACGNFPTHHPNNESEPQTQFRIRYKENAAKILNFLKKDYYDFEPACVRKAKKLFRVCTWRSSFRNTTKPIEEILQKLGIPIIPFVLDQGRTFDYTTMLAKLSRLTGIKIHFDVGTSLHPLDRYQNSFSISSRKNLAEMEYHSNPILRAHPLSNLVGSNESISPIDFTINTVNILCKSDDSVYCQLWYGLTPNERASLTARVIMSAYDSYKNLWPKSSNLLNNTCETPRVFTLKQVQDLTDAIGNEIKPHISKLDWKRYIEETFAGVENVTLDLSDPSQVEIAIDDYYAFNQTIRHIYKTKKYQHIEAEIWYEVVITLLPYLHWNVSEMKTRTGAFATNLNREELCAALTITKFDTAVSYMYKEAKEYEAPKTEIQEMFQYIKENFKNKIQKTPWMDRKTKLKFLLKIDWVYYYILYPDLVSNSSRLDEMYENVKITNDFYDSFMSTIQDKIMKELTAINKRNYLHDERNFPFATDANAFYDPYKNYIMISGGIVGAPFYRNSAELRALNYGSLGTIIGHELTHGFDFSGRCYDHLGNYKNWWKPETWAQYKEKGECFVKAYNRYNTTLDGITQKGSSENTLCEDMSDNGGFTEALSAYRTRASKNTGELYLPEFANFTEEQLFTLAYANVWCENPLPSAHDQARNNTVHSPNGVRVNGVLRNSKEFAIIWDCPKGSNMNPSDDKCTIW